MRIRDVEVDGQIISLRDDAKYKRFDSYDQFQEEFLNLNPGYKELRDENGFSHDVCEDNEYRIYRIMLQPRKVPAGFYVRETWTCFVFEKDDIESIEHEYNMTVEDHFRFFYDQPRYDD